MVAYVLHIGLTGIVNRGGLGRQATWHLPSGPVGPPTRWATTSNVEVGQMKSTIGHFIFR